MIILGFGKWDQQDQFIEFAGNHGNNIEPKSHHKYHIPASYFRASAIKHNKRTRGSVANIQDQDWCQQVLIQSSNHFYMEQYPSLTGILPSMAIF